MIFTYQILTLFIFLLTLPFLPLVLILSKKRRANLLLRLGFFSKKLPKTANKKRIWIHALSVGEVRSALPLVQALVAELQEADNNQATPSFDIVFSASTVTGHAMARQLFGNPSFAPVVDIFYFPFDLCFSVNRVINHISPDLVCIVETDFWPGFLHATDKKQIPVLLVNARLSRSSLKGYLGLRKFKDLFFRGFSQILVQTKDDQKKFQQLGVDSSRITLTGNIKFDMMPPAMSSQEKIKLRQRLGIREDSLVWIAGSTHDGEEKDILEVFDRLESPKFQTQETSSTQLSLILAPRNPERCKELVPLIKQYGFVPVLYSDTDNPAAGTNGEPPHKHIILIDVMGVLARTYAICNLAFVGGSLVPEGGHNPLEPAMYEKPVLFGWDMSDFQEIARIMEEQNAAQTVKTKEELYRATRAILFDPDLAKSMGNNAARLCRENTGAVNKTITAIQKYLYS